MLDEGPVLTSMLTSLALVSVDGVKWMWVGWGGGGVGGGGWRGGGG